MALVRLTCVAAIAVLVYGCVSVNAPLEPSATPLGPTSTSSLEPGASALPTIGPASLAPTAPATDPQMTTAPTTSVPTATPTGTPTAPATPRPSRIRSLEHPQAIDCNVNPEPTSVHLEWEVVRATGATISIDGPGIYDTYEGRSGSADVPFACGERRHTYLLTTIGGDGADATREIVIRRARPQILAFSPSYVGPNGQQCNYRFVWSIATATGVRLFVDGTELGSYSGQDGDVTIPYNCPSGNSVTYGIETTATYGPQASQEVQAAFP